MSEKSRRGRLGESKRPPRPSRQRDGRELARRFTSGELRGQFDRLNRRSGGTGTLIKSTQANVQAQIDQQAQQKAAAESRRLRTIRQIPSRDFGRVSSSSFSQQGQSDLIRETQDRAEGFGEEVKNFLFSGLEAEFSRGSGVVRTGSGKAIGITPETEKLFKETGKHITPDTFSEKLMQGRLAEIDLSDPRTQGQIGGFGTLLAAPVGSKGVSGIKSAATSKIQKGQIKQLEKSLQLPGQSEKLGKDVFITGGGTEGRPQSVFITKFGKKSIVQEVTPTGERQPTLSPEKTTVFGKLDPTTQRKMGTVQEGKFRFTSDLRTGKERRTFQTGTFQKEIKEFAKVRQTELKNILKKKPERILKDIKKPPSVFVQTKAERLTPPKSRLGKVGKEPSTPFSFGPPTTSRGTAGSVGKAAVFTKQQERLIKQTSTPTKTTKKKQDAFGTLLPPATVPAQTAQEQVLKFPPGQKAPTRPTTPITDVQIIPTVAVPKPKETEKGILATTIRKPGISFTPEIKTKTPTDFIPPTTIITPKEGEKQRPRSRTGTPTKQITTQVQPPLTPIPPPPEIPTVRRPPFLFGFDPARVGQAGGGSGFVDKSRVDFLGSTRITQIHGFRSKKKDFDFGPFVSSIARRQVKKEQKKKKPKLSEKKSKFSGRRKISFGGKGLSITGKSRRIRF